MAITDGTKFAICPGIEASKEQRGFRFGTLSEITSAVTILTNSEDPHLANGHEDQRSGERLLAKTLRRRAKILE